jgi:hypothetical protein
LVCLRNPWGEGEWEGDWRDNDRKWSLISDDVKKSIGYYVSKNDGIFFMTLEDFCENFENS